jgi:hypothetical protein
MACSKKKSAAKTRKKRNPDEPYERHQKIFPSSSSLRFLRALRASALNLPVRITCELASSFNFQMNVH